SVPRDAVPLTRLLASDMKPYGILYRNIRSRSIISIINCYYLNSISDPMLPICVSVVYATSKRRRNSRFGGDWMKCPSIYNFYRAYFGIQSSRKLHFALAIKDAQKQLGEMFTGLSFESCKPYWTHPYARQLTPMFLN